MSELVVMQSPTPSRSRHSLEALRSDPYRLFFPLGVLLSWWGVGQWLLFSLHLDPAYRVAFHSMAQVQGFLGCFVAGFLFTFIPRRTGGAKPAIWQLVAVAVCPVALCVFAWFGRLAIAQSFWLIELGILLQFVVSRALSTRNPRAAPPSLLWVPVGLGLGLVGAVLSALPSMHDTGRSLVLEAMVTALVMGIGAMLVPVVTRAEPPSPQVSLGGITLQVVLAGLFVASFIADPHKGALRLAYGIRLLVVVLVLVRGARLWRWPTEPGLNRRVVWFAAWSLPVGDAMLSIWPAQRAAGLHVIYLGSFGLLALAIGQHVIAAHGGQGAWLASWSKQTFTLALLTTVALIARLFMQFDPSHFFEWMTCAAIAFVAATFAWLWGMVPMLLKPARSPH